MANTLAVVQANNIKQAEYWISRLLTMIKLESEEFLFSKYGREITIPKNQGTTTISLRRYNSLPIRDISTAPSVATGDEALEKLYEGVPNKPLKVEAQKVQATVDQFGAWLEITDRVDDIHFDDIKREYQPELARHAAEVRERNVIAKIAADCSVNYAGFVKTAEQFLTTNELLTLKDLRKMSLIMKVNNRKGNEKAGGKPITLVHPNVMADLMDDEDFSDRYMLAGQDNAPIKSGNLQGLSLYGMYVVETLSPTLVKKASEVAPAKATLAALQALHDASTPAVAVGDIYYATTPKKLYKCATVVTGASSTWAEVDDFNIYRSFMLGREPYAITSLGSAGIEWKETGFEAKKGDELGQKASIGYKMYHGAKTLDPIAIQRISSRSAYDVSLTAVVSDPIGAAASQA